MCIMHYFDDNHIFFIEYHEDVAFLLTKIFAKLKWIDILILIYDLFNLLFNNWNCVTKIICI